MRRTPCRPGGAGATDASAERPRPQSPTVASAPGPPQAAQQSLAEFTTETELPDGNPRVPTRAWRLGVSFLVLAALTVAVTALWLGYVQPRSGIADAATLPAPAAWTRPAGPSVVPLVAAQDAPGPVPAAAGSPYAIQVASFVDPGRAQRSIAELAAAGFRARVVPFDRAGAGQRWLQVLVDGRGSLEDAASALARIRALPGYGDALLLVR